MMTARPLFQTPISDIDTPALLVDLDALDHNFSYVAELYSDTRVPDASAREERQESADTS